MGRFLYEISPPPQKKSLKEFAEIESGSWQGSKYVVDGEKNESFDKREKQMRKRKRGLSRKVEKMRCNEDLVGLTRKML
jgi:hypothetical protein